MFCDAGESSIWFSKSMSDQAALNSLVAETLLRLEMRASARSLAYGQSIVRPVVTYAQDRRQSSTGNAEPRRLSRRHGGRAPHDPSMSATAFTLRNCNTWISFVTTVATSQCLTGAGWKRARLNFLSSNALAVKHIGQQSVRFLLDHCIAFARARFQAAPVKH